MNNTPNFANVPAILDSGKTGTLTGRTRTGRGFNEYYEIDLDGEGRKWVKKLHRPTKQVIPYNKRRP